MDNSTPSGFVSYQVDVTSKNQVEAEAWLALARLLIKRKRYDDASRAYRAYFSIRANEVAILREYCLVLGAKRDFGQLLLTIDLIEGLGGDVVKELAVVALVLMHRCDWQGLPPLQERLRLRLCSGRPCRLNVMCRLAANDDPVDHLQMAKCISTSITEEVRNLQGQLSRKVRPSTPRVRTKIAYLSKHFNNHVISMLLVGLIENHDRSAFEVYAYDFSVDDESPLRKRMTRAFDRVVPLRAADAIACAERIISDNVDVLIDIDGLTSHDISAVVALRPAPLQISFLGHVGTHGGNSIDYVIADRHVLPVAAQKYWHEAIAYMPNSYLPNDRSRPIPNQATADGFRSYGLPGGSFVFACFNSSHKITKRIYQAWMTMLHSVPGSVLWVVVHDSFTIENLLDEARRLGIRKERIVFAERVPYSEYIARYAYADLFLDTPYNGHTTVSDALWCGLPVLTLRGISFAARVGSSLLNTIGLPELIVDSIDDYVTLGISLATNRDRLHDIQKRLIFGREYSPLFDSACYARDFEAVIRRIALVRTEPSNAVQ